MHELDMMLSGDLSGEREISPISQIHKLRGVSGAAAHVCRASEELSATGYAGWSDELRCLLEALVLEITFLEERLSGTDLNQLS